MHEVSPMSFAYEYPRAALTVDAVVFGFDGEALKLLLIERALEPFKGRWALPGGFVRGEEELEAAARRELSEETGITEVALEQFQTFGAIRRDPRERVVSVAYVALTRLEDHRPKASTDARQAVWFPTHELPRLAFDHQEIIDRALERLRTRVRLEPIGFQLLPAKFTLTQFQSLYESILGRTVDTRNFRKRVLAMELVVALKKEFQRGRKRPAQLFRFDPARYEQLKRRGFQFEL
jgi:8-oxo-dGTP diphosphatase